MKKLLLIGLLLFSAVSLADGVDDPNFYRDFDKHPCQYNLGFNEDKCIEPQKHGYVDINHFKHKHTKPPTQVPEPSTLGLLGLGCIVGGIFARSRKL